MKVLEIKKNKSAYVEASGVRKEISIELLGEVRVGDYVMVHAGFAIEKVDASEAEKTLEFFKEYEESLKKNYQGDSGS